MITEIFPNFYFLNIKSVKLIENKATTYKKYMFKSSKYVDKNFLKSMFKYFLKKSKISIKIVPINKTTKKIYLTIYNNN